MPPKPPAPPQVDGEEEEGPAAGHQTQLSQEGSRPPAPRGPSTPLPAASHHLLSCCRGTGGGGGGSDPDLLHPITAPKTFKGGAKVPEVTAV